MKKIIALTLILALSVCGLSACGKNKPKDTVSPEPQTQQTEKAQEVKTDTEPDEQPQSISTTAEYSSHMANIKISLPEGWSYKITEDKDFQNVEYREPFGIEFYPDEAPDAVTKLYFYPCSIGLCGTGVTIEDKTLPGGTEVTSYTEAYSDSDTLWQMMIFKNTAGTYASESMFPHKLHEKYDETILSILGNAQLGEGYMPENEAIEKANSVCTVEHGENYGTQFDYLTGNWTVPFKVDGDVTVYVTIDSNGKLLDESTGL